MYCDFIKYFLQSDWCTSYSNGYHKMTLTLTEELTSDQSNSDPCLQFSIQNVPDTNLFLLLLGNRQTLGCDAASYKVRTHILILLDT